MAARLYISTISVRKMGLLSIIRKQKVKDREIRVLVLGLDSAGKTTIIRNLMGQDPKQVSPTMGFQIQSFEWKGFSINAWDIGGQTSLRAFWSNYFDRLDFIIWVVDSTSVERLQELYQELRDKVILQDQLVGTFFLLMINKVDMIPPQERAKIQSKVVQSLGLLDELHRENYHVCCVSGMSGEGLNEAMDWVISKDV